MSRQWRPKLVVGIDLGTTFSGICWMEYNPNHADMLDVNMSTSIRRVYAYPGRDDASYPKTPTALYYPADGSPYQWGEEAVQAGLAKKDATSAGGLAPYHPA